MTEYQKVTITMVRTKKYPKFNLLTNQWEWTTLLSQTGAKSTKKLYYSVNPGSTGNYTTGTPVQLYIWYYRQTVLFPIDVWHFPVNRINLFVDLLKVPNQTEQQLVYNQYMDDYFTLWNWTQYYNYSLLTRSQQVYKHNAKQAPIWKSYPNRFLIVSKYQLCPSVYLSVQRVCV